jgi:hypothetical protein
MKSQARPGWVKQMISARSANIESRFLAEIVELIGEDGIVRAVNSAFKQNFSHEQNALARQYLLNKIYELYASIEGIENLTERQIQAIEYELREDNTIATALRLIQAGDKAKTTLRDQLGAFLSDLKGKHIERIRSKGVNRMKILENSKARLSQRLDEFRNNMTAWGRASFTYFHPKLLPENRGIDFLYSDSIRLSQSMVTFMDIYVNTSKISTSYLETEEYCNYLAGALQPFKESLNKVPNWDQVSDLIVDISKRI